MLKRCHSDIGSSMHRRWHVRSTAISAVNRKQRVKPTSSLTFAVIRNALLSCPPSKTHTLDLLAQEDFVGSSLRAMILAD
jgi:hypothetical protein